MRRRRRKPPQPPKATWPLRLVARVHVALGARRTSREVPPPTFGRRVLLLPAGPRCHRLADRPAPQGRRVATRRREGRLPAEPLPGPSAPTRLGRVRSPSAGTHVAGGEARLVS